MPDDIPSWNPTAQSTNLWTRKDTKPAFQLGLDADGLATNKSEMERPVGITCREKWYIGLIIAGLLIGGAYVTHRNPSPLVANCAKGEVRGDHSAEFQPLVTGFAALLAASIAYLAAMKSSLRTAKATAIAARLNAKTSRRKIDHEITTDEIKNQTEIELRRLALLQKIISAHATVKIYDRYIKRLDEIAKNFGIQKMYDHVYFRRLKPDLFIISDEIKIDMIPNIKDIEIAIAGIIIANQSSLTLKNYINDIRESRGTLEDQDTLLALYAGRKQIYIIENALYKAQKALDPEMKIGNHMDNLLTEANEATK